MHKVFAGLTVTCSLPLLVLATPLAKRAGWPSGGPTFTVTELGSIFDPNFPGIQRDGGGSGRVNGYNTIFFSDSYGTDKQGNSYFVSNTLTYFGYNDASNPLNQFDFGDPNVGQPSQALFNSPGDEADQIGNRVALWPSSNLVAINSTHMMGFASLTTNVTSGGGGNYIGLTQFLIQPTSYGPITTRMVDRLWEGGDIGYGGFGSIMGLDGYQYLFAGSAHNAGNGIKVARHPANRESIDKLELEYWNGQNWNSSPPASDDTAANIINYSGFFSGPYTGDIYYDVYHGSIACVFMESGGGAFYLSYPTGTSLTGSWSTPIQLAQYDPTESGQLTYAGHAHPEWDSSGDGNLLMSYSNGGGDRRMVMVNFTS